MQVKFVTEVVVNFLDPSKLPVAKTAVLRAAAALNAKLAFLNDGHQPQVICYSEDFFAGRVDLEYLNEKMLQEQAPADDEEPMSDELLQALKGGR
jgi:hypothetical protein